ncbi:Hsp33 family molecular chaperone HslO [Thiocapsa bogorovii]|uniref:Hsp33 family molecular chaperone HslO n=1 Tax=Thiocapsa bogorovii TaxID=521689 RepID=UPI001E3A1301|nr:Hsp33 family molecular chaperone HslO [Thiocapsa bogorovii]UHD16707.1 Hsp33 family molecular chaperone HslO [Thiocapsa bogorovii]
MSDSDRLYRFTFENIGIRGNLVHLDATWRAVLGAHPYPEAVRNPLGESLAAVTLLASTIKFEGSLILQAQGKGPIRTLVAQATHEHKVRGLARWEGEVPIDGTLAARFGEGHLALTIERRGAEPYQGIVPLEGSDLSAAIERYFVDSEQLPTRLWLTAGENRAAGLLLQRLPGEGLSDEDWSRIGMLAGTLTPEELTGQSTGDLLYRLFNEESIRLFEPEPIAFRCGCSRTRIEETLKLLGPDEVDDIIAEQGAVSVTCEFCNRNYAFDAVDAKQLFAELTRHEPSPSQH